jgi:microcystin degradation protein MlrC
MKRFRIAIGAIFTECNELGGVPIDISWFERYELNRGEEILAMDSGVVGGMLRTLHTRGAEVCPLLYASTCPGGPLTASAYRQLRDELLDRLSAALPIDGVLLPLHGAAAVENIGDLEGDLLCAVREIVGAEVPIVGTLDLHAHVTAEMVRCADALVAWKTYPHRDAFTTGERSAHLLMDTLTGHVRPTMAMAKVPVITSAIHGSTDGSGPFARLVQRANALETRTNVLSTNMILVHPYLDQPQMGSGAIVVTDNDLGGAVALANELAYEYWDARHELEPETHLPAAAINQGLAIDGGPILLVETADCAGGGAAGDSVATLSALLNAQVRAPAYVPVVDPDAAAYCQESGVGETVNLAVGHHLDPRWGQPIRVAGTVVALHDGRFKYRGGIYDGVEGDMGPTALLAIGPIRVLITTFATYEWLDEQWKAIGLNPAQAKFLVVKNPMNFSMAYGEITPAIFILDTPGPTPGTLARVRFQRLDRPYFPLDREIPDLQPTILAR